MGRKPSGIPRASHAVGLLPEGFHRMSAMLNDLNKRAIAEGRPAERWTQQLVVDRALKLMHDQFQFTNPA